VEQAERSETGNGVKRGITAITRSGAIIIALLLGSCGNGETGASTAPVLFQWEDYVDPPFLSAYRKQYGETPRTSIFADEDEAFAKLRAGFKADVMGP
jgi:spermidine/putrescine-binding protein